MAPKVDLINYKRPAEQERSPSRVEQSVSVELNNMQNNNNTNIPQSQEGVQSNAPANSDKIISHKAIIKLKPEAALAQIEENLLLERLNDGKLLLAPELKEHISFRALMEADGHKFQTSGNQVKCCCPFHPDRTPSFFIHEDDSKAKCYGCNWYGDIFKYESEFHRIGFKQAWWRLNDFIRKSPRTGRKAKALPKKISPTIFQFTEQQLKDRKRATDRLATETQLAEEVCRKRQEKTGENWDSAIIRQLAVEGSLGWGGDCIAFLYAYGTKYREWPTGRKTWDGEGLSLWRGRLVEAAAHVYLMESETDAIALLHSEVERKKPGHVVVAVPGAMNFKPEWAPLFRDKVVTFCFDNDRAGEDGVKRAVPLVEVYAKEVRILDWKGVA